MAHFLEFVHHLHPRPHLHLHLHPHPQQQLNTLESAEDVKNRHDVYHQLYVLVLRQRQQKRLTSKAYETYEWSALIKQIIRCRFPLDIKNYDCYKRPDVVFSVETY